MERSTARVEDSADRRTELAADRTVFAAERTYAAWVRTGLVAMASGIGAKALLMGTLPNWLIMATGSVFMLFSVFCFGAGVWRHLYPGPPPPMPDAPRIHPAALVFVNAILVMVSIADADRHLVRLSQTATYPALSRPALSCHATVSTIRGLRVPSSCRLLASSLALVISIF